MGSHSVTCHPTEVTVPSALHPAEAGTRLSDPGGDARLSCVRAVGRVSDRVRWDIDHAGAAATTNERTSDDDLVQLICRQEASNPQI